MNEKLIIMSIFIGFALLEFISGRFLNRDKSKKKDAIIESISTTAILVLTVPGIIWATNWIGQTFFSELKNTWSDLGWPMMLLMFIFFDDMVQYWWHRTCHKPLLYGLHRAHHSANYMSVRVVYRNNLFFYMIMPNLWITGFLIYFGLFEVYPYYLVAKMLVIFGAHSSLPWDRVLHSKPWLSPIGWLVERTISTPSTHHAHHGMHIEDGVTNYKGNYGNMLFIWDVIFGTAHITRKYPDAYGIENLEESSWQQELFWPLVSTTSNSMDDVADASMDESLGLNLDEQNVSKAE
ncbi:MAG: fatty acid hydroxylase [Gammaproteobacteria bacterium]|nr:MAG: fatty acid hydroxylase [Gammaproteobacteria bacterium]